MQGLHLKDEELHDILSEVDINKNGQVELGEYLELMSQLKSGNLTQSRFARAFNPDGVQKISVERSGGGL